MKIKLGCLMAAAGMVLGLSACTPGVYYTIPHANSSSSYGTNIQNHSSQPSNRGKLVQERMVTD